METQAKTDHPRRLHLRLRGYDYSQNGVYFVTICTRNRELIFGEIMDGAMRLSASGEIVREKLLELNTHYPHAAIDTYVVMPNHIHVLITISDVGAGLRPARIHGLNESRPNESPEIVRALKAFSTRRINETRHTPGAPVWQRNYYEHVIRNEDDLDRVREYIEYNPARWAEDEENPDRIHL